MSASKLARGKRQQAAALQSCAPVRAPWFVPPALFLHFSLDILAHLW
jgi:hypothetical protein